MSRARRRKGLDKEPPELDITTFLNLMVVLIPFLLLSAVFSRITIMELDVPTAGVGGAKNEKPTLELEVIVRKKVIEISNGKGVVARMANIDEKYDIEKLSDYLQKIKKNYPDKTDAIILMERTLEYEHLITIMDVVRSASYKDMTNPASPMTKQTILFPHISVGDAP
ncbi:MAG: biopolymer transporter ExbD [Gammaproteobacteria bacterium]|nr:biopolymer transporter ExbD [Gammaproteobacteria bacterium]